MSFQQNLCNISLTDIIHVLEKLGFTVNFQNVDAKLHQVFFGTEFIIKTFNGGVKIWSTNSRFQLVMSRDEFLQEETLVLIKLFLDHPLAIDLPLEKKEYETIQIVKGPLLNYSFVLNYFGQAINLSVTFDCANVPIGIEDEINLTDQIRSKILEAITYFIPENCSQISRDIHTKQIQMSLLTQLGKQFTLKFEEHFLEPNVFALLPKADIHNCLNQDVINYTFGCSIEKGQMNVFFDSICEFVDTYQPEVKKEEEEEKFIFNNIIIRKEESENNEDLEQLLLVICEDLLSLISLHKFSPGFIDIITDDKHSKNPELIKEIICLNQNDIELKNRLSLLYDRSKETYAKFYSEILVNLPTLTRFV